MATGAPSPGKLAMQGNPKGKSSKKILNPKDEKKNEPRINRVNVYYLKFLTEW